MTGYQKFSDDAVTLNLYSSDCAQSTRCQPTDMSPSLRTSELRLNAAPTFLIHDVTHCSALVCKTSKVSSYENLIIFLLMSVCYDLQLLNPNASRPRLGTENPQPKSRSSVSRTRKRMTK